MTGKPLVLGTAQFGSSYGISNLRGRVNGSEVFRILELAWKAGVRRYDTAPAYGSEQILGNFVRAHGLETQIEITTKAPSFTMAENWQAMMERSIGNSLKKLNSSKLKVVFLHDPNDLTTALSEEKFFFGLLKNWPIGCLGVSVYSPSEVLSQDVSYPSLAYQFPYSLLDRRFESVTLDKPLRYARSIFLQGLIAPSKSLTRNQSKELVDFHKKYHKVLSDKNIDALSLALNFVRESKYCDQFLAGVTSVDELKQILTVLNSPKPAYPFEDVIADLGYIEPRIFDPRFWC